MKIAILGDTHFGARNDNTHFHAFFQKFYKDVFFPYIDEHKIYHSIHLLQDDDFVYFKLNIENLNEFDYIFAMNLEQILRYVSPEIKGKFLKDTTVVDKSMLLWKTQSVDSA